MDHGLNTSPLGSTSSVAGHVAISEYGSDTEEPCTEYNAPLHPDDLRCSQARRNAHQTDAAQNGAGGALQYKTTDLQRVIHPPLLLDDVMLHWPIKNADAGPHSYKKSQESKRIDTFSISRQLDLRLWEFIQKDVMDWYDPIPGKGYQFLMPVCFVFRNMQTSD